MLDPMNVIAHAANDCVKQLAQEYEVSLARMYEILGKDNPYPKTKRLVRAIGRFNQRGVREIRADFNAMCDAVLLSDTKPVSDASLHKELNDVLHARFAGKLPYEQRKEILEAIAILQKELELLEQ